MLVLLFLLAAMVIALGAAAPRIAQQIKREREIEMIHRGEQYARAIKRYYRKFGRYPTRIEELENTNNLRFLRKRYKDPMSEDGKWRFVRYGEIQMGQTGTGGGSVGGAAGGSGGSSDRESGGSSGRDTGAGSGGSGSNVGAGGTGLFGGQSGGSQQTSSLFGSSSGSGSTGGMFGGGPILGVASTSEKPGIHEFNNKRQYNQWLFIYDPTQDPNGTRLIKGPYNPKAFVGQFGGGGPNQPGQPITPDGIGKPGGLSTPSGLGSPGGLSGPPRQDPPNR